MSEKNIVDSLAKKGIVRPDLCIGVVCTVRAYAVQVNLRDAGYPSGTHYEGGRYGRGEVGEFVIIEGQQNIILGRIIEVLLLEKERKAVTQTFAGLNALDAIGHVQLLGTIAMDNMQVTAGVEAYPRLGDRVYAAPHELIAAIPSLMMKEEDRKSSVELTLGQVDAAPESKVKITPEKLFGRHCAILGATGGGKSWTTARLIEECAEYKAKLILLDATGEYKNLSSCTTLHYHLKGNNVKGNNVKGNNVKGNNVKGNNVNNTKGSKECFLPHTCFTESDFIAMFQPSGKVQGPKLRAAIKSLRLAKLSSNLATAGVIEKINKEKEEIIKAEIENAEKLNDPQQPFDVNKLPQQIEQECVYPNARGARSKTHWGLCDEISYSYCLSLITRISAIFNSSAFYCVFSEEAKEEEKSVIKYINSFIKNEENKVMRICLSGIAYEYDARGIIANCIGRHLMNEARNKEFESCPLIVLVDEAHNFLGRHIGGDDYRTNLDAFELIAKEGRKYSLSLCLATQRPRDITEGVLSQMGTMIVHRLTNNSDREMVERACGEIDRSSTSFLPNLQPGEAVIIGIDFPIPLTIQISEPADKPESAGPNFQKSWENTK